MLKIVTKEQLNSAISDYLEEGNFKESLIVSGWKELELYSMCKKIIEDRDSDILVYIDEYTIDNPSNFNSETYKIINLLTNEIVKDKPRVAIINSEFEGCLRPFISNRFKVYLVHDKEYELFQWFCEKDGKIENGLPVIDPMVMDLFVASHPYMPSYKRINDIPQNNCVAVLEAIRNNDAQQAINTMAKLDMVLSAIFILKIDVMRYWESITKFLEKNITEFDEDAKKKLSATLTSLKFIANRDYV